MAGFRRLCGRWSCVGGRNEPERGRGREIQAFTAFVGGAGWSAGRKEPRAARSCTRGSGEEVGVFKGPLNGDGCGVL